VVDLEDAAVDVSQTIRSPDGETERPRGWYIIAPLAGPGTPAQPFPIPGVPPTAVRYGGIIHDFVMLNALHDTNAATAAVAQASTALRDALHPADTT
jgi:hypothetical protein